MDDNDGLDRLIFNEEKAWDEAGKVAFYKYKSRVDAISAAGQREAEDLLKSLVDSDEPDMLKALEDGMVDIIMRRQLESSKAAAEYYDAERLRQTGLRDGFRAKILEFTEEDERSIREDIRRDLREVFGL